MNPKIIILGLAALLLAGCSNSKPESNNPLANLQVTWELKGNVASPQRVVNAEFAFYNGGNTTIEIDDCILYFNQTNIRPTVPDPNQPARVEHINGDFYRLVPSAPVSIKPGDTLRVAYSCYGWMLKERDAPAGLYFVSNGIIVPVKNYTVTGFDRFDRLNPMAAQGVESPTPEFFFNQYSKLSPTDASVDGTITPTPKSLRTLEGTFTVGSKTRIVAAKGLELEAQYIRQFFREHFGITLTVTIGEQESKGAIQLRLGSPNPLNEAYTLTISPEAGVVVEGASATGVFYGIQSLLALVPLEAYRTKQRRVEIMALEIDDAPRFSYRGLHLDVARNFHPKETVKRLIDVMAFYKLNTLHLHLTEDEGWRLEIMGLPELTELGARRGHTLDSHDFLPPAYGSGPFPNCAENHGTGYYTREDYIEILRYARSRHIRVIPEINFPGHARAAIMAMEARYRRYMEQGNEGEANRFRLIDPDDESQYLSAQLFNDNIVCVARESVYDFYDYVVNDLVAMHQEAGTPLEMLHTGGDEVPRGAWAKSPLCMELLGRHPEIGDPQNLQSYFLERLLGVLAKYNIVLAGWEEVAQVKTPQGQKIPNPSFAKHGVVPYVWDNTWGNIDLGFRLANAGYKVVMCNVTNFYFDLAYDANPFEPGLYWAGFVDTRSAFEYVPYMVVPPPPRTDFGGIINPFREVSGTAINPESKQNILGVQAQLWSETLKGQDMLERALLPKLIGLAERAWSKPKPWEGIANHAERNAAIDADWNRFAHRVGLVEQPRLDYLFGGYMYRIAAPGIKQIDGLIHSNMDFPGYTIRYTTDGSEPTARSAEYTSPVEANEHIRFRAFTTKGRGGMVARILAP